MENDGTIIIPFPFDPATVREQAAGNPDTYLKFAKHATQNGYKVIVLGQNDTSEENEIDGVELDAVSNENTSWLVYGLQLWIKVLTSSYPDDSVVISSHPLYLLPWVLLTDHPVVFESVYEEGEAAESADPGLLTAVLTTGYSQIESIFLSKVDRIIVSPRYRESYAKKYPHLDDKIECFVHESIDSDLFYPRDKKAMRSKWDIPFETVILHNAVVNRKKRQHLVYKALSELGDSVGAIFLGPVGDEEYKQELDALAEELEIQDRIKYIGHGELPYSDIPELTAAADVSVFASVSETGPIPALEAFATEIPIVSTDVGLVPLLTEKDPGSNLLPVDIQGDKLAEGIKETLDFLDGEESGSHRREIVADYDVESNQAKRLESCEMARF
jgi:glycosyltransferase involved in cell wall biosynthesis